MIMHKVAFTENTRSAATRPSSSSEGSKDSTICAEAAEILDQVRAEIERNPERARAAALQLLMVLTSRPVARPAACRGGLAPWQKRKVDCYLRENLKHPVRVDQLAREVSLSVSHFCRAFKESFGITPHTHIIRLRLELAQHLMLTTRDPLSHIALACGLADQAHLTKLFQRWVGETPNVWRRQRFSGDMDEGYDPPLTRMPGYQSSAHYLSSGDRSGPVSKTVIQGNPQQFCQSGATTSILG
jgi:AraC family transcriptional regulator